MPYEVRVGGQVIGAFKNSGEAEARAREVVLTEPETEPEIIDTETGRPYAPGASEQERDELANKIGF